MPALTRYIHKFIQLTLQELFFFLFKKDANCMNLINEEDPNDSSMKRAGKIAKVRAIY